MSGMSPLRSLAPATRADDAALVQATLDRLADAVRAAAGAA